MTARPELQNVRLQVPRLVLALLNAYGNVDRDTGAAGVVTVTNAVLLFSETLVDLS